jgi:hypothetical protein
MRPLQIWLPRLQGSLARPETRRDRERAFRAWRGEGEVWTLPAPFETGHWQEPGGIRKVALRGEQVELIHVCHLGANGFVSGPGAAEPLSGGSIDGLLEAWLNLPARSVSFVPAPPKLVIRAPRCQDGDWVYRWIGIPLELTSFLPIKKTDEETHTAWVQWPPEETAPLPASPEAESADRYGSVSSESSGSDPAGPPSDGPASNASLTRIRWPEPFARLLPILTGLDDLFQRDQMVAVAKKSHDDLPDAISEAQDESIGWLSEGQSTRLHAWLEPIIAAEGEQGALSAAESQYDLQADNIEQGLNRPEWRDVLDRPMPIRRVWGIPGLCWSLLLDRLEDGLSFRHCERCSRLIHGRSHKRFCGRDDDGDCYRTRRSAGRRKERARRRT